MGGSGNDKNIAPESNVLLAEILDVLKRIDGHLQAQESRINDLGAKVAILTPSANGNRIQTKSSHTGSQSTGDVTTSPRTMRKESIPPTFPLPRPRDLRLQIANRTGSVDTRDPQDEVSVAPKDGKWDQDPHIRSVQVWKRTNSWRSTHMGSIAKGIASSPKTTTVSRRGTWHSIPPPPTAADRTHIEVDDDPAYTKFPPPNDWITTRTGRFLDVRYNSAEAKALWTRYLGDSWVVPPDGRIEMSFQKHLLGRLDKDKVTHVLQTLNDVSTRLEYHHPSDYVKRGSFRVTDFGFDPSYEESVAEYRAEVLTGRYKNRQVPNQRKGSDFSSAQTAPWKRMIEVRGLSKKLIDEHETWTRNFRDPWSEALPVVSPICPFLTDRERDSIHKTYTGMNAVNQALLHHQQCLRQPPPSDDNLTFHVTFYEIVDLTNENELDGEIWRSGRLHSDNEKEVETIFGVKSRRIRESACTIVVVPDPGIKKFWTSIYLCPNNFDLYDKTAASIINQDVDLVFVYMIEFTMRMLIERWSAIAVYFAWLIGHRDTLSDPDAHDSLLFDDDTFSRSRRYFWAINYLAELDMSISENIAQLESHFKSFPSNLAASPDQNRVVHLLRERSGQLKGLRARLCAQREEAIALRDGLFSASGVMESRASTRLGENVKLLTFVSIFFLPLSFCMSIWSVNDTIFSLRALLIVVILVGLGTYTLVFNLNNMVNFCSRVYDKYKKQLIIQMKDDPDSGWNDQGKRFATFKPKQENFKPSEWVIGLFLLHQMAQWFNLRAVFPWKRKPAVEKEHGERDILDYLPELPELTDAGPPTQGDPLKIKKTQIKEKMPVKGRFSRLSKVFRRGALSPDLAPDV